MSIVFDDDHCIICCWNQSTDIFDQNYYCKAKKPTIIDQNGYHSVLNTNGYNFPISVCSQCLHEKILNGDEDYIANRHKLLDEINSVKRNLIPLTFTKIKSVQ